MRIDMDKIEQQIVQYIDEHKEDFIKFLRDLIRINSVTGYEKKAQEFVQERIAGYGLETELVEADVKKMFELFPEIAQVPSIGEEGLDMPLLTEDKFTYEQLMASKFDRLKSYKDRPNLIGKLKGKGGGKSLIINGHIDTVPVGDRSKWHFDPFGAEIKDGFLYGRGAVDMKGGVASMVATVEALTALKIPLSGDLMFQTVVNEEHAGGGALGNIAAGYTADAAIVTEPTGSGGNFIQNGNGGGVYWDVRIKGYETHAGSRWQNNKPFGISAIEKAALVIDSLISLEKGLNKEKALMSLCIGTIKGGTYATATAAECVINGVAYFSPDLGTGKDGITKVKKMLKDAVLNVDDAWLKANPPTIKFQHYDDAYMLPEDRQEIKNLTEDVIRDVLGKEPVITQLTGGCDARHFGNQGGIPAIVYGAGDMKKAHSTDECINLDDYIRGIKVLTVTIYRWCQ